MRIVRYEPERRASILADALVVLMSGGTIVYPTETTYGLGGSFFSPQAYRKIIEIKKRNKGKPLPVIVPNFHYATTLVQFTPDALRLAQKYWPGPLTLVLPLLYRDNWLYHGDDFLAVRVSSHPFASSLASALGSPLISTSANLSGQDSSYVATDVIEQLHSARVLPDLIIDAGVLPQIRPSTIIKADSAGLNIIRPGAVVLPTLYAKSN